MHCWFLSTLLSCTVRCLPLSHATACKFIISGLYRLIMQGVSEQDLSHPPALSVLISSLFRSHLTLVSHLLLLLLFFSTAFPEMRGSLLFNQSFVTLPVDWSYVELLLVTPLPIIFWVMLLEPDLSSSHSQLWYIVKRGDNRFSRSSRFR